MSSHHHQHEYHHHEQHQQEEGNVFTFPSNGNNNNKMTSSTTLVGGQHHDDNDPSSATAAAFETSGMLSEMFNFGQGATAASEILDYRRAIGPVGPDWYGPAGPAARQLARDNTTNMGDHHPPPPHPPHHQIPSINADSAAAMQLFLTNPQPRSPSPPPPPPPPTAGENSTLHMLSGFHPNMGAAPSNPNFWGAAPAELGGIIEGQGLSLSLSSSLQQLEAAKQAQEFRNLAAAGSADHSSPHHSIFFTQNQQGVGASSSTSNSSPRHFIKQLAGSPQQPILQTLQGGVGGVFGMSAGPNAAIQHQVHLGFGPGSTGSSVGVVNVLRSSKYAKPAQELLEEFCSVGRGQIKKAKLTRQNSSNPNQSSSTEGGGGDGGSSSTKDPPPPPPPPLSPADRIEHQRRKVKLLSMLDEVDRRYNHYCEQMQMVVNSFDMVMGYGAATPYTALAQKAMSRHFRCLKDAIQAQLKQSCEVLGEKDPSTSSGITKGETPRLKVLEQSLRQQRAFHQMGMMDQEAWRPQRGLPERSVNILRAWLFEHFLHPYPSDADKHLLARQTGLSRNQVSNWFINARVRLWKPMIEEMYQQESKEAQQEAEDEEQDEENKDIDQTTSTSNNTSNTVNNTNNDNLITTTQQQQRQQQGGAQNPMPSPSSSASASASAVAHNHNNNNNATDAKRSAETMTPQGPSHHHHHGHHQYYHHHHHHQQPPVQPAATALTQANNQPFFDDDVGPATMIRFGTTNPTGDVSLTLGLRHAGNNAPDKTTAAFSLGDFGSC